MHGILTTWRLRTDEGLEHLIQDLDAHLAADGVKLPGHVAGYAVQVAPARMMTLNIYEDAEQAETAAHALALATLSVMADHAEIVECQVGPSFEITTSI